MLRQIVEDRVHDTFSDNQICSVGRHLGTDEASALIKDSSCSALLISLHEFHGRVMAHGNITVQEALYLVIRLWGWS